MKPPIALGADHGGFFLKNELALRLKPQYEIVDLGAHRCDLDDDYPDFAAAVARTVASRQAGRGILVCGSGVGACVAANKVPGIRAGLCHDTYSAHQGVEDDDMNVLCLGARVIGLELAAEIASTFLKAKFSGKAAYRRRYDKITALEQEACQNQRQQAQ
ncbi:MAG: RpiB/LacA/LacB family sugar-phosphate isomerase [Chloroflexota bacterium]